MKNRGIFVIVLVSFIVNSAFADTASTVFAPILNVLGTTLIYVSTIVGSVVAIFLVSVAWVYISMTIWRSGSVRDNKIVSSFASREQAKKRLSSHGFGGKELNLKSYHNGVKADEFRKKFASFEDWQDSSDFKKVHNDNINDLNNHEMNFERHFLY